MWDLETIKADDFGIVPAGQHTASIVDVKFKESKAGAEYLSLMFKTDKGNVFNIMNVNHPTEQVRNIALAELKRLIGTCGITTYKFDSKEALANALQGAKCDITVKHKTDDYGTKAVISGYKPTTNSSTKEIPF